MKILDRLNYKIVLIPMAVLTGFLTSFFLLNPAFAEYVENNKMATDCSNFSFGANRIIDDTTFDPEKNILIVRVYEGGITKPITLPNRGHSSFSACSADAVSILDHAYATYKKRNDDLCVSLKELIKGERPLVPKGGKMPQIEGAISFVKEYCN